MIRSLALSLGALTINACGSEQEPSESPIRVEIVETESGYQFTRGGEPYVINGAGMSGNDIEDFASHGGNSIRTWTTKNESFSTRKLLDDAHANGVSVALGLSMMTERWGFDYNDDAFVAEQLASFREEVLKYRDHPALLFWIIGNELNHEYTNSKVYDAVNDVAAMIRELDPNHPTTTTLAGIDERALNDIEERAPKLDFVSFQVYGGLYSLPDYVRKLHFTGPFVVSEWGAIGYWEVDKTTWDAPIEATSSEKADIFMRGRSEVLASIEEQLLGSYAFLWGQKQERTPTWFGMFTEDGEETEVVDVMHYLWTGSWPDNRVPQVHSLQLDGKGPLANSTFTEGEEFMALVDATDPDGDSLIFDWELKPESQPIETGGDYEEGVANLGGFIGKQEGAKVSITAPEPGFYRLFVYVRDGNGHAGHANIPFRVRDEFEQRLDGQVMAVVYSGYRESQHPDRGDGAVNPTDAEILEDLEILVENGFDLIRLYDTGNSSSATLRLIREQNLPINVLLGVWLRAEVSNHEGCPWLDEAIPDNVLAANAALNEVELQRGIKLAREFENTVVAVNVGNEALVDWNDHMVPVDKVIEYVRAVKGAIIQPVTVADNYAWWIRDGAALAAELDFVGVHTYPAWENKTIDQALDYTIENIHGVQAALPDKPIAILEAGWASLASEFGERANEADQARYFRELKKWAEEASTTVFFFEAFDEPWKGNPNDPNGAEKHWGLFNVDRTPKKAMLGSVQ